MSFIKLTNYDSSILFYIATEKNYVRPDNAHDKIMINANHIISVEQMEYKRSGPPNGANTQFRGPDGLTYVFPPVVIHTLGGRMYKVQEQLEYVTELLRTGTNRKPVVNRGFTIDQRENDWNLELVAR